MADNLPGRSRCGTHCFTTKQIHATLLKQFTTTQTQGDNLMQQIQVNPFTGFASHEKDEITKLHKVESRTRLLSQTLSAIMFVVLVCSWLGILGSNQRMISVTAVSSLLVALLLLATSYFLFRDDEKHRNLYPTNFLNQTTQLFRDLSNFDESVKTFNTLLEYGNTNHRDLQSFRSLLMNEKQALHEKIRFWKNQKALAETLAESRKA